MSLAFEVLQYIFSISVSGITDLINNVIGGFGLLIYKDIEKWMKNRHQAHKYMNITAVVGILAVLLVLFFLKMA